MRTGDLLEWVAGLFAFVAAVLASGRLWVGFAVLALFIFYESQCYASEAHVIRLSPRFPGAARAHALFHREPDVKAEPRRLSRFPRQRGLRVISSREEAFRS